MNKSQTKSLSEARIKRLKKEADKITEKEIDDIIYNCTLGVENSFRMFEYKRCMKENKLIFPFIMVSIVAIMYFIAFHEMRDERNKLREDLKSAEKELKTERK